VILELQGITSAPPALLARRALRLVILLLFPPIFAISSTIMVSSLPRFSRRQVCATRLQLIGTVVMQCVPCTRLLCPSCLNHFILIVRMLLTTMPLSLSLILTLTLVRLAVCLLLYFLWEAYRDCFHVFLSLCVFLFLFSSGFARGARHSQPLFATRPCVFCNQLAYGRLVIRRAVKLATLGS
jgi:hypothetical protein